MYHYRFRYTLYLGGNEKAIIRAGRNLFDGEWHTVKIHRRGRITSLKLDTQFPTAKILPGLLDLLYLNNYVFVGGMIDMLKRSHGIITPNYKGCLADLLIDDTDILQGAHQTTVDQKHTALYAIYGVIPFKCHVQNYEPVTFMTPQSYVKVTIPKLPQDNGSFSLSFKFRTLFPNGLLLSHSAGSIKMNVRLKSGALLYDVVVRNGSKYRVAVGGFLDDGEWHDVTASISMSKLSLTLDGYLRVMRINTTSSLNDFLNQSWTKVVAGSRSKMPGFVGCMLNLKVDSEKIALRMIGKKRFSREVDVSKCSIRDRCLPNPCRNRGVCSQDWQQFYCDCSKTYFEGKTCEISLLKPTCEDYRRLGLDKDAHCLLHTGSDKLRDRFTALCNVTDPNRSYTVVKHSLLTGTRIRVRDLDLINGQYRARNINYNNIEKTQIAALVTQSRHCRQYVRFDCIDHNAMNTSNMNYHVTWKSLDTINTQNTWDLVNVTINCGCSKNDNNRCRPSPTKYCDCKRGWTSIEGFLHNKDKLPITGLQFNQMSTKQSSFQLGPLECWGKTNKQTMKTNTSDVIDMACYYVEAPVVAKVTPTTKIIMRPCKKGELCRLNETSSIDPLGPIEWTNPPNIDSSSTQENSHFNVRPRETSITCIYNASRMVTFVCLLMMMLFV